MRSFLITLTTFMVSFVYCNQAVNIIPQPQSLIITKGEWSLPTKVSFLVPPKMPKLALKVKETFLAFSKVEEGASTVIQFLLDSKIPKEGYELRVAEGGIEVRASGEIGLFYGLQTIKQLLPVPNKDVFTKNISIPFVKIEDAPQFSWRGSMVDLSRSFFSLGYLKAHVDRMAFYKLNRLHLHLTDDQGWRIEIPSRPNLHLLASKGAVAKGKKGFLSSAEYIELQQYALEKHIVVIPEVDVPGHTYAALLAYPELNCEEYKNLTPAHAKPPAFYEGTKVNWTKLCLNKPKEVYSFVNDVFSDLAEMTIGPWIHMGGDEISDPLFSYFVTKADSIIRSKGKTVIGWQEIRQAKLHASTIVQVWRKDFEPIVKEVAAAGNQSILSPCSHLYFDHANETKQIPTTMNWCETQLPLKQVYSWTPSNYVNVLGVEAPVWTELVHSDAEMDNRFWPRLTAMAEIAWTKPNKREYQDFKKRLGMHGNRMTSMGISYFPTPKINWNNP